MYQPIHRPRAMLATMLVAMLGGSLLTAGPTAVADPVPADRSISRTAFALQGSGFATKLRAAQSAVRSGKTAWSYLGCTKAAGLRRHNGLADATRLSDFARGGASGTTVETMKTDDQVATRTRNNVSFVRVASEAGSVRISGIESVARAWHGADGFQSAGTVMISDLHAELGGTTFPLPAEPQQGQVVTVPGVARITFFTTQTRETANEATASTLALQIKVLADGSTLSVGRSYARISDGAPAGVLGSYGLGARGDLIDNRARIDKVGNQPLGCEGTDGEWVTNPVAAVNAPGALRLAGVEGAVRGIQRDDHTGVAQTVGRVARATIGNGQVVIRGIEGAARVVKNDDGHLQKSVTTEVASLTVNGERRAVPDPGDTIRIPGVVAITGASRDPSRHGIGVTALTIRLLAGSDADSVVRLGSAHAKIEPR